MIFLAMLLPASIFLGIGLAMWEYENGGPPEWLKKCGDFLCELTMKIDKFLKEKGETK